MEALPVSKDIDIKSHKGNYQVYFNEFAIEDLNNNIPDNAHFIVDKNVAKIYKDKINNVLNSKSLLIIEAIEANKSLDKFPAYVEHLVINSLRRGEILIAIGGGIIQDIVCFLAATMLRGIEWSFYPTTLLSQADSCIGSKSSINSGGAKNILGTYTPPCKVHISASFLDTLDQREVLSGIGEMIKVHIIDGPLSFDKISQNYNEILTSKEVMINFIYRSLAIKKIYIEIDEFDQGIRNIFNYGHSFGHAIESATNFFIPHGIAVSIGMDMANFFAMKMDIISKDIFNRMHPTLSENYANYSDYPIPIEAFIKAISKDKKNINSDQVTLILLDKKSKVFKGSYENNLNFKKICEYYFLEVKVLE
jgi:3-dehydroquinate synthase